MTSHSRAIVRKLRKGVKNIYGICTQNKFAMQIVHNVPENCEVIVISLCQVY